MNVLVTGGAGYKGIVLVEALLEKGHDVTLVDNFMYGYDAVLHLAAHPRLSVRKLDVRNVSAADTAAADAVFHLAGIVGMPACAANPHAAESINVQATQRLARGLGRGQLLVYASTTSLYGTAAPECDETAAIHPVSLYAKTKHAAEQAVMERDRSIALRFATVFGVSPRMRTDLLVNDFAYRAVTERAVVLFDGRSKRTFMHIRDAIGGYLFALEHAERMCGGVYNVGDAALNFSKRDIAEAIRRHVQFEIVDSSLPDRDVRDFRVSFQRLQALGYRVAFSLDDGIRELLKLFGYYRSYSPFRVI